MNMLISSKYLTNKSIPILIGGLLFLFFISFSSVSATEFYVDATGGDNLNSGTSTSTAWKTLSKINAGTFNPGDYIYLKRGEIWREQITFPSSGSTSSPIIIDTYGDGNKPVIYGSSLLSGVWTQHSGNIYKISLTTEAKTVLNGTSNLILNDGNYGTLLLNQWD